MPKNPPTTNPQKEPPIPPPQPADPFDPGSLRAEAENTPRMDLAIRLQATLTDFENVILSLNQMVDVIRTTNPDQWEMVLDINEAVYMMCQSLPRITTTYLIDRFVFQHPAKGG